MNNGDGPSLSWTTSKNIDGVLMDVLLEAGSEGVDLVIETTRSIILDVKKYLEEGDVDSIYPIYSLLEAILSDNTNPEELLISYIPQGNGMYKDSSVGKLRLESDWTKYEESELDL
jgi:hypothetical protein